MKRLALLLPLLALAATGCATRQSATNDSFGKPVDETMYAYKSVRPGVNLQMIRIAYAVDFGFQLTSDVFPADADTNDFAYVTVNHFDDENPNMSISGFQLRRFWRGKDTVNEMGQQSMVNDPEPTLEVSFQDLFDSISKWNPVEAGPSSSVAPSSAP